MPGKGTAVASKSGSGITVLVVVGLAALASAPDSGCGSTDGTPDPEAEDDDFSFAPDASAAEAGGLPACDDVVIVESASGPVEMPGDDPLFSPSSLACQMGEGMGDGEAVAALQDALVRCNGQAIGVDGGYGPDTARAVSAVQGQHGLAVDGAYGPDTGRAMRWPADTDGAACVDGASLTGG